MPKLLLHEPRITLQDNPIPQALLGKLKMISQSTKLINEITPTPSQLKN